MYIGYIHVYSPLAFLLQLDDTCSYKEGKKQQITNQNMHNFFQALVYLSTSLYKFSHGKLYLES